MFDLAVIGAGPAGSTIARLLGDACKIALFEKNHPEGFAPAGAKCCGGLIAPDAQATLARFGLGLPREVLSCPQLFVVRCLELATGLERCYQRHYINIDRRRFDRWLQSLIPDRVFTFAGCLVTAVSQGQRGVIIHYLAAGKKLSLEARTVVGADGAASLVRKGLTGGHDRVRRYFTIQERHPPAGTEAAFSAIFDPAVTDFYAWMIPKHDALILGAALAPDQQPLERFRELKQKLVARGLLRDRPLSRKSAFLLRPRAARDIVTGTGNILLAGEAAGLVSPSSGEGISFALRSAALFAAAFRRDPENVGELYQRAISGLKRTIVLKSLKAAFLSNPVFRGMIMASGWQSLSITREAPHPVHDLS